MAAKPEPGEVAAALRLSVGLLVRRIRQTKASGELTLPEISALARLDRGGPTTATALAKLEQISPQSMGATLTALESRGFVERVPHPDDGRQAVISATKAGLKALGNVRGARVELLARGLSSGFSDAELSALMAAAPLLERLAEKI